MKLEKSMNRSEQGDASHPMLPLIHGYEMADWVWPIYYNNIIFPMTSFL